jgi:hypothetical protein
VSSFDDGADEPLGPPESRLLLLPPLLKTLDSKENLLRPSSSSKALLRLGDGKG